MAQRRSSVPTDPQRLKVALLEFVNNPPEDLSTRRATAADLLAAFATAANGRHAGAPLTMAAQAGRPLAVRAFLEAGADPNGAQPLGRSPLICALNRSLEERTDDRVATVRALLDAGADPNATDQANHPALLVWLDVFWCTRDPASLPVLRALLEAGANPNCSDSVRRRALTQAVRSGAYGWADDDLVAVETLLAFGADPTSTADVGYTMLMRVAKVDGWRTPIRLVQALVEAGGDLLATDVAGNTLLHHMMTTNDLHDIHVFLLRAGVDPLRTNNKNETALDRARAWNGGRDSPLTHALRTAADKRELRAVVGGVTASGPSDSVGAAPQRRTPRTL